MGLFLPKSVPGSCVKQYVQNEKQARFQLNAIPLNLTMDPNPGWKVYFPRPFQIIGLSISPLENIPAVDPAWPMIFAKPDTPAVENTYSNITPLLMLELALANCRPLEPGMSFPVEYLEEGIQERDYRGYFTKFLNDEVAATREQWFNTFMMPANLWKHFTAVNAAATADVWYQRFQEYVEFIEKTADQRLYGSPGVYVIQNTPSTWAWSAENEYYFINES